MPAAAIEIEDTPNPHAMKYIADRPLNPGPTRSYRSPDEAVDAGDDLAQAVFAAGPIVSVMIVNDFITVNKKPSARWGRLNPTIEAVLRQHLDG
ncbi:MAG: NifU N-terminal domain-containing protein [Planctomycetota bacterium]